MDHERGGAQCQGLKGGGLIEESGFQPKGRRKKKNATVTTAWSQNQKKRGQVRTEQGTLLCLKTKA